MCVDNQRISEQTLASFLTHETLLQKRTKYTGFILKSLTRDYPFSVDRVTPTGGRLTEEDVTTQHGRNAGSVKYAARRGSLRMSLAYSCSSLLRSFYST